MKHKCNFCGAIYARGFALRDHIKEQHSSPTDDLVIDNDTAISDGITLNFDFNEGDVDDVKSAADSILTETVDGEQHVILNADDFDQTEEVITDWIK